MKKSHNHSYLIFILVLSILAIIALAVETFFNLDQSTLVILAYLDYLVCALFFIDFIVTFIQSENKVKYLFTWGWLDLLSSIPVINVLRVARIARVFRIFRVLRGIKSAKLITNIILEKRSQSTTFAIILVSIVIVAVSSISILHFESDADGNIKTPEDSLWWAAATITTVGYGDRYPITTEGRVIAFILMISGVGLFGTISGFVASWFISPSESNRETDFEHIRKELDEIREMLYEIKSQNDK